MQMLNPCERQTIIEFSDADSVVTVFSCSPSVQETLMTLCKKQPDEAYYVGTYHHGNSPMVFFIPRKDYRGLVG